jgi:hypothetical protein
MEHVAILERTGSVFNSFISAGKTIEHRTTTHRKTPYHNITPGEPIYLKVSGSYVGAKGIVEKAEFFEYDSSSLFAAEQHAEIYMFVKQYVSELCMALEEFSRDNVKRYSSFVFVKDVKKIRPFYFDKNGFGTGTAWITTSSIEELISDRKLRVQKR